MPPVYTQTQLLIVGGGPGGYVAAIRAAQLGIKTILVEGAALGGTCLNVGCIPSKALIHAAEAYAQARAQAAGRSALGIRASGVELDLATTLDWKDSIVAKLTGGVGALLKKHGVTVVKGWAELIDGKTVEVRQPGIDSGDAPQRIQCEHLLLAAGSQEVELPFLPFGAGEGRVVSSTEALVFSTVPKQLVVVGAGYIGLELGTAWRKLGAEVTVVEAQERILPGYDAELVKPVAQSLARLGLKTMLAHRVEGLNAAGTALTVRDPQGALLELPADKILVAVGRRPRSEGWGLERLMLDMNGRAVKVDAQCRTSMKNVWAIGDLTGEPLLAHRAMAQGELVAELIAGHPGRFEPAAIPAVCFTDPEIVSAGHTPDSAEAEGAQRGFKVVQALFPFAANGRALSLEAPEGFVRVVARADNHLILGWQAVGAAVSELSAAFGLSLEMGARLEDVAHTIHSHPTLGEAVQECCLRALGQALHI
ncbi:dihydrolipoyl dehydrogenase [Inhella sp.]|uniref:dihydrolipoyl dehydrogenase n=1 Tax=Inhella sp. TaxID=1921806 RepID=UPI0035B0F14E